MSETKSERKPVICLDLTHIDLLPLWMTPEMISGKNEGCGDFLDANACTGTISQLQAAFNEVVGAALAIWHLGWLEITG